MRAVPCSHHTGTLQRGTTEQRCDQTLGKMQRRQGAAPAPSPAEESRPRAGHTAHEASPTATLAWVDIALQIAPHLLLGRAVILLVVWTVILTELVKLSIIFMGDG